VGANLPFVAVGYGAYWLIRTGAVARSRYDSQEDAPDLHPQKLSEGANHGPAQKVPRPSGTAKSQQWPKIGALGGIFVQQCKQYGV
jgi:hypothetical protein